MLGRSTERQRDALCPCSRLRGGGLSLNIRFGTDLIFEIRTHAMQHPVRMKDLYQDGQFDLSIEIFPPKKPEGEETLRNALDRLSGYRPAFISCTYGAGGSTREKTLDWCRYIMDRYQLPATAHLTCVGSTREELREWLGMAHNSGIPNIMALRGDPPKGQTEFTQVEGGLRYGNELVELIREDFSDFGVGVAGYPETHQECADARTDLDNLKRKVDAGADAVYTQMFYINENFFEFRERYEREIDLPLIPGIMPITSFARIKKIADMCGAIFPDDLAGRLEAVQDDKQAQFEIGVEHAIKQCQELIEHDVPGIHFYALNRSTACERILQALGIHERLQKAPG